MTRLTRGPRRRNRRATVVVLDGVGVGALPDAGRYGDEGAHTLRHVLEKEGPLQLPHLACLGLANLPGIPAALAGGRGDCAPSGGFGRMTISSPGKDTTGGHWELAGVVLKSSFPVYPNGFPPEVIEAFERAIGRRILGNIAASGTEIIQELGERHLATGQPIVYTSADSVFQIAAHEDIVPPEELYRWCLAAREILQGEHAVGRVIARPFTGSAGNFTRTYRRRDFSLSPPEPTMLDRAAESGCTVAVVGKVADIFNHRGITLHRPGGDNEATVEALLSLLAEVPAGLLWATLGDFDTRFGHRNDSRGFARALESFDLNLPRILSRMQDKDLLFITADHGCDPVFPGTDHTREYVPLLVWGPSLKGGCDLGTRDTMADLGATVARWLDIPSPPYGRDFLDLMSMSPVKY